MSGQVKKVEIFTDGACLGNPEPGGYGVILRYNGIEKELSGGELHTTNNRMELLAAIAGLSCLKERCCVALYSDSQYLVNGINNGWAERWQANGWMRNKKEPAINSDLWKQLLTLLKQHDVTLVWVRGHSGHPENERCDALAVTFANNLKNS